MRTVLASMPVSSRSSRVAVWIGDSFCSRLPPKSCHSPFLPRPATHPFVLMRKKPAPVKWARGWVVDASPGRASVAAGLARWFVVAGVSVSVALSFSRVGCLGLCVSSACLVCLGGVVLATCAFEWRVCGVASALSAQLADRAPVGRSLASGCVGLCGDFELCLTV